MRSPGAVRGTNTARPSASRPTPSPPAAIPVMVTTSFTETFPPPRLTPHGPLERWNAGKRDWSSGTAPLLGEEGRGHRDGALQAVERRRRENRRTHALQVGDVERAAPELGVVHHAEMERLGRRQPYDHELAQRATHPLDRDVARL